MTNEPLLSTNANVDTAITHNTDQQTAAAPDAVAPDAAAVVATNVAAAPQDSKGFYESLPDELKKHEALKKFNTKEDLASSYLELSNKLGKRFEDLSEDEVIALDSKFGVPDKAEGYELTDTDNIIDTESLSGVLKGMGMPKHLGDKIFKYLKEATIKGNESKETESVEDFNRKQEESIVELKKMYGIDWDKRLQLANKAIKHQPNGEALYAKLTKARLTNDIDVVNMFVQIGQGLVEDKILGEDVGSFGMSPEQATEELGRLSLSKQWTDSLMDTSNPNHAAAQRKFADLHKIKARLISGN